MKMYRVMHRKETHWVNRRKWFLLFSYSVCWKK